MRSSTMHILLPTSSFKTTAAVVITAVSSVAAAISFTVPSVSHFLASSVPIVYDNTVFLLKPPYLYLVINCIIVSIVATSKLTHKSSSIDDSDICHIVTPIHEPSHDIHTSYLSVPSTYTGFVQMENEDVPKVPEQDKLIAHDEPPKTEKAILSTDSPEAETDKPEQKNDTPDSSIPEQSRKPPRFGNQKSLQANPEGGGGRNKKPALGVTKPPRKQDTLETTWKKITEGRSTPLTKHLTKSDTWQERTQHVQTSSKTTKSVNSNDVTAPTPHERLNREPSPGQEELNRRVEAFINKFNEEMRLQRLQSLAKYNEIVNGGTPL